ncbi:uncharacterized protein At4g00950-like [Rutidosis leptorrhynchoides]|uniref:uncharacterized protein At4g00950-like n=1 Tax=Rutidosis leptorrhynchoides TaxID=125765 RepID=UPI003A99F2D5
MGSESNAESDPNTTPRLPLFSMTPHDLHHEPSGMLTPPLQTSASVPFRWEEQPGKPRPCTDIIIAPTRPENRSLDLPPRLAIVDSNIMTKIPSPTTVLDGPSGEGISVFSSRSFRFTTTTKGERRRMGSFDSNYSGGWSPNDDELLLSGGNSKLNSHVRSKSKRFIFGSFRLNGAHKTKSKNDDDSDANKGSFVISPSSVSDILYTGYFEENKRKKMKRNSSLSKVTKSNFWAALYAGFKQVVPWKKKPAKESFTH